jgi:hypothetical protein
MQELSRKGKQSDRVPISSCSTTEIHGGKDVMVDPGSLRYLGALGGDEFCPQI